MDATLAGLGLLPPAGTALTPGRRRLALWLLAGDRTVATAVRWAAATLLHDDPATAAYGVAGGGGGGGGGGDVVAAVVGVVAAAEADAAALRRLTGRVDEVRPGPSPSGVPRRGRRCAGRTAGTSGGEVQVVLPSGAAAVLSER